MRAIQDLGRSVVIWSSRSHLKAQGSADEWIYGLLIDLFSGDMGTEWPARCGLFVAIDCYLGHRVLRARRWVDET